MNIDQVSMQFDPAALKFLNIMLALIMFSIALDMRVAHFKDLMKKPWPVALGLFSQFVALPAVTFLFVYLVQPQASLALGLILVAACPGGNISNFITHLAGGNSALSVTLSAFATSLAIIMTPFNVAFWGSKMPETAAILTTVALNPLDMALVIVTISGIPLVLGIYLNEKKQALANRLRRPLRILAILIFGGFIGGALIANWKQFMAFADVIAILVLLHNGLALGTGWLLARLGRLDAYNRRAVTIETGIQNSGLGLILIFGFFNGLGGMAIIAAWWGGWHAISGMALAHFWSKRKVAPTH